MLCWVSVLTDPTGRQRGCDLGIVEADLILWADRGCEGTGVHDGDASCVKDSACLGDRGAVSVPGEERSVFEYVDCMERDGGDSVFVLYVELEWVVAWVLELVKV